MASYTKEFLLKLYKELVRIRLCEESLVEPILAAEVCCPVHLCSGQEAIATGVCSALRGSDHIFGTHRSHGHYLAKGGGMKELIAEIYGKETGCSRGRGGSMHIIAQDKGVMGTAPIVGGTIALAVGGALASKIKKDKRISVCFFGDGATGEGVFYEALNFASLKKLPVIFVCENNLYSTHLPIRECRPLNNIFKVASHFSIRSFRVDGNDVLGVYETAKKAIKICRNGRGPVFIECMTYRLRGHVGPNDNVQGVHTDIRPKREVERWRKRDPILVFEKYLRQKRFFTEEVFDRIKKAMEYEVRHAHRFAKESPYPKKEELTKYVFTA